MFLVTESVDYEMHFLIMSYFCPSLPNFSVSRLHKKFQKGKKWFLGVEGKKTIKGENRVINNNNNSRNEAYNPTSDSYFSRYNIC